MCRLVQVIMCRYVETRGIKSLDTAITDICKPLEVGTKPVSSKRGMCSPNC